MSFDNPSLHKHFSHTLHMNIPPSCLSSLSLVLVTLDQWKHQDYNKFALCLLFIHQGLFHPCLSSYHNYIYCFHFAFQIFVCKFCISLSTIFLYFLLVISTISVLLLASSLYILHTCAGDLSYFLLYTLK